MIDSTQQPNDLTGQRWVVKIGSALITNNGNSLAHESLSIWVDQIAALKNAGVDVVLVSSGSVAEGIHRLGMSERPSSIEQLQAAAAIGQAGLIQSYESLFAIHAIRIAQILLVHGDLSSRTRYLNARKTINTLLDFGAVPIVNENDTVATDEIRFGDNDTLAGLVSNLVDADKLLILTDQDGVFDDDPRRNHTAQLIAQCDAHDSQLDAAASGSGSALGRGGMATKIKAARLAARSATPTHIANGREPNVITRIANGESLGTLLTNQRRRMTARKQWLANLAVKGQLHLDDGAVRAVKSNGVSLLPIGVKKIDGTFDPGELVSCIDSSGQEFARGLSNYSSDDANRIAGKSSEDIAATLGYGGDAELIHRDNLVLI